MHRMLKLIAREERGKCLHAIVHIKMPQSPAEGKGGGNDKGHVREGRGVNAVSISGYVKGRNGGDIYFPFRGKCSDESAKIEFAELI